MKRSDINHLRRLLGWVSCEIGQEPAEMVAMVKEIAGKLGPLNVDDDARRRMVEAHDKARAVPKYVRAAVMALGKAIGPGEIMDAEAADEPAAPLAIQARTDKPTMGEADRYTPGPWTAQYREGWNQVSIRRFVKGMKQPAIVCSVRMSVHEGDAESNARLILVAPELHAELKKAYQHLQISGYAMDDIDELLRIIRIHN